jgi:hypothetical protein
MGRKDESRMITKNRQLLRIQFIVSASIESLDELETLATELSFGCEEPDRTPAERLRDAVFDLLDDSIFQYCEALGIEHEGATAERPVPAPSRNMRSKMGPNAYIDAWLAKHPYLRPQPALKDPEPPKDIIQ